MTNEEDNRNQALLDILSNGANGHSYAYVVKQHADDPSHYHEWSVRNVDGLYEAVTSHIQDYITANYTPRQSYIELLNLFGTPTCESLHHPKKYQHRAVEDCPVVERIAKLTNGEEPNL